VLGLVSEVTLVRGSNCVTALELFACLTLTLTLKYGYTFTHQQVRESAILALGAVSEGCHMGLAPYLNDMVKMLVPVLQVGGLWFV
jgi:hypothetical protein